MLFKIIGSIFLTLILGSLIALGTFGIPVLSIPIEKEIPLKLSRSSENTTGKAT